MNSEISEKNKRPKCCDPGKIARIIAMVIGGIVMAVVFALVLGLLVKALWNWLMPALFGLPVINYWQAFGIIILSKILFGGFGRGDHDHDSDKKKKKKWDCSTFPGGQKDGEDSEPEQDGITPEHWKYYKQYWKDEGKEAFDTYVDKVKEKEEQEKEQE